MSQELVWVLSWNSQRILKGENQLTKRQCMHATTDTNTTATFTIILLLLPLLQLLLLLQLLVRLRELR